MSLSAPAIGWRSVFVICGLGVAVYWNSFPGTFLLDDFGSIQENVSIRSLATSLDTPLNGQSVAGRPIANVSLAINYALGQFRPWVYLATNLSIHIVCGMLVMALAGLVSESLRRRHHAPASARLDGLALTAACVWLVHPLTSEPVNYIVARTESLMALCALTTLYASLRAGLANETTRRWEALALVAGIIGMGCKESMVVVPLMAVLLDRALLFDSFVDAMRHRGRFYALLASTLVVALILQTRGPRGNTAGFFVNSDFDNLWFQYLFNQCRVLTHYAMLLVWPRDLVLDYGAIRVLTLQDVLPQLLAIVAAVCGTLALWRQSPLRALPIVWALVVLAPTTLVPIVTEVGADRRMYLASVGLIVGSTFWLGQVITNRLARRFAAVVAVVALAALTMTRNLDYKSPYRIWTTVVERWPHSRAYQNLAVQAEALGRHDEVLPLLRKAAAESVDARVALGVKLYETRQYTEAIDILQSFLRERPNHHQSEGARKMLIRCWTDVGIARANAGDLPSAVEAFRQALRLEPANQQLQRSLARALEEQR